MRLLLAGGCPSLFTKRICFGGGRPIARLMVVVSAAADGETTTLTLRGPWTAGECACSYSDARVVGVWLWGRWVVLVERVRSLMNVEEVEIEIDDIEEGTG